MCHISFLFYLLSQLVSAWEWEPNYLSEFLVLRPTKICLISQLDEDLFAFLNHTHQNGIPFFHLTDPLDFSLRCALQGTVLSFIRTDNVEVVLDIVNHATQEQLMNNIWVFVSDLDNKEIVSGFSSGKQQKQQRRRFNLNVLLFQLTPIQRQLYQYLGTATENFKVKVKRTLDLLFVFYPSASFVFLSSFFSSIGTLKLKLACKLHIRSF